MKCKGWRKATINQLRQDQTAAIRALKMAGATEIILIDGCRDEGMNYANELLFQLRRGNRK
jgi:hypothetical protein